MYKRLILAVCVFSLIGPAHSQTQAEATGAEGKQSVPPHTGIPEAAPEPIQVVGQRPGPGLWKISKGEHVLWVFGMYSPLPKNMEWRSQQVETVLAQSQEYLTPPSVGAKVGFFKSLTLLPYAIGLKKNPDGAHLRDVLPADVYARWQILKKKYLGDDDGVERERPIFAAEDLYRMGLFQAGLSSGGEVRAAIENIVKKNKIKTTALNINIELDDPARLMKEFKKSSLDDVACFSKTLDRLETDIDAMRIRAHAWAKGDLEAIEKLSFADRDEACKSAMMHGDFMKAAPGFQSMQARMDEAWLAAAEKSLGANASTFAILPLRNILDPKGYVATLQAKGYTVEKPE